MTPQGLVLLILIGLGCGIPLCFIGAWLPGLAFSAGGIGAVIRVIKELKDFKEPK